ncbi:MAG: DUF4918 family protein [Chitinophagaceae bacterium]|nr:DUF4918 family protein [Chitinophagaceae bacterium]
MNDQYQWFQEIDVLPHPRFIMQYKRKYLQDYITQYLDVLGKSK